MGCKDQQGRQEPAIQRLTNKDSNGASCLTDTPQSFTFCPQSIPKITASLQPCHSNFPFPPLASPVRGQPHQHLGYGSVSNLHRFANGSSHFILRSSNLRKYQVSKTSKSRGTLLQELLKCLRLPNQHLREAPAHSFSL